MPVDYKSMYHLLMGKTVAVLKVLDTAVDMAEDTAKSLRKLKNELVKAIEDVDEIYIQTDDEKHEE